jgi:hypothetical protein
MFMSCVLLNRCDMFEEPTYEYNDDHRKSIDQYYNFLSSHRFLDSVNLDYSLQSVRAIQLNLSNAFIEKELDPRVDINHLFERAILVYIGEVYLKDHPGTWISTHEKQLIPFGIRVGEKTSVYFVSLIYDVLRVYPYDFVYTHDNKESLFNFMVIYDYIGHEL